MAALTNRSPGHQGADQVGVALTGIGPSTETRVSKTGTQMQERELEDLRKASDINQPAIPARTVENGPMRRSQTLKDISFYRLPDVFQA